MHIAKGQRGRCHGSENRQQPQPPCHRTAKGRAGVLTDFLSSSLSLDPVEDTASTCPVEVTKPNTFTLRVWEYSWRLNQRFGRTNAGCIFSPFFM